VSAVNEGGAPQRSAEGSDPSAHRAPAPMGLAVRRPTSATGRQKTGRERHRRLPVDHAPVFRVRFEVGSRVEDPKDAKRP
jgi:hypothetical protein